MAPARLFYLNFCLFLYRFPLLVVHFFLVGKYLSVLALGRAPIKGSPEPLVRNLIYTEKKRRTTADWRYRVEEDSDLDKQLCTFTKTGTEFAEQPWFFSFYYGFTIKLHEVLLLYLLAYFFRRLLLCLRQSLSQRPRCNSIYSLII